LETVMLADDCFPTHNRVVLGKCRGGRTKYSKQGQHLFHVNLLLRAGFDLIDLSGYGRQSTGGANPRREVSV